MPRVQAIVVRNRRILMVKHRQYGFEWWCLPGGGQEPGETPAAGALRELQEECNVAGVVVRQTAHVSYATGWAGEEMEAQDETYTFLVEIGDAIPSLGTDPDIPPGEEILVDMQWLALHEIAERDRAFLWAAGLLGVADFAQDIESWGDRLSYPGATGDHG